jgi:hypothetical protein
MPEEVALNKFLSNPEDNSRRDNQLDDYLSGSRGPVSNSIGRMSFGRSKKQSTRSSQGNIHPLQPVKKDYTTGLMAIEERLKVSEPPKIVSDKKPMTSMNRIREAKVATKNVTPGI